MGKTITKTVRIEPAALTIISGMEWIEQGGQVVGKLTCGQLDRKMYEAVNKGLDLLGGKWNKKVGGHVFGIDPRQQVAEMLGTGAVTVERDGFFRTPRPVVLQMLGMLNYARRPFLEPSAGDGAILEVLKEKGFAADAIERNPQRREALVQKGYTVLECTDFMEFRRTHEYKTIVMNPPFEQLQDVDHVTHAFNNCLATGGELVSVMAESAFFRADAKCRRFRQLVDDCGYSVDLPEGAFKESGTMVKTRLVYLSKWRYPPPRPTHRQWATSTGRR